MAEMDDAIVVADDFHMVDVVSMAKRQQARGSSRGFRVLHVPLPHPRKCRASRVTTSAISVADAAARKETY